jgi:hypothetical protein
MTGTTFLMIKSGRRTPIDEIPTPDLAVPYAAPKPGHVSMPGEIEVGTGEHDGGCAAHCTLRLESSGGDNTKNGA